MHVTLDFETRSILDLQAVGAQKYASHPSTLPLCMCYAIGDGDVHTWLPGDPEPEWTRTATIVEAHNAPFEMAIMEHIMVARFGWHPIPLKKWRCSMAKGLAFSLPGKLDQVAKALGVEQQKDVDGHRVMLRLCKPHKVHRQDRYKFNNKPEDFEKLFAYCPQDVRAERDVSKKFPPLRRSEQAAWFMDRRMNRRGLHMDRSLVEAASDIITALDIQGLKDVKRITKGVVDTIGQIEVILTWCKSQGVTLENLQVLTVTEALESGELPSNVHELLRVRQAISKTSTKKIMAMITNMMDDDCVRDTFQFLGAARTGRWAGRGMQPQNFPRKVPENIEELLILIRNRDIAGLSAFGDPLDVLKSCLRGFITPHKGKVFRCADFAAIEARVLAWLAGDEDCLEDFRNDVEIYVNMAKDIYGDIPIRKEVERDIGKRAVLGCGFGVGGPGFQGMVYSQTGKTLDVGFCCDVVKAYREKYPKIVRFWYDMEKAAFKAYRTGRSQQVGRVKWGMRGNYLHCKLPSGRLLTYPSPRLEILMKPWGERKLSLTYMGMRQGQWVRLDTYGAKTVENVTQAVARDFMKDAMMRLDVIEGYDIVGTVHDEDLAECDPNFDSLENFTKIMEGPLSDWAKGCPIKAEAWEGYRYGK